MAAINGRFNLRRNRLKGEGSGGQAKENRPSDLGSSTGNRDLGLAWARVLAADTTANACGIRDSSIPNSGCVVGTLVARSVNALRVGSTEVASSCGNSRAGAVGRSISKCDSSFPVRADGSDNSRTRGVFRLFLVFAILITTVAASRHRLVVLISVSLSR